MANDDLEIELLPSDSRAYEHFAAEVERAREAIYVYLPPSVFTGNCDHGRPRGNCSACALTVLYAHQRGIDMP